MKFFDLDSPFMQFLNKVADLLWLNVIAFVCCIPIVTVGASLTALHSVALKIVRNEEGYITRNYFKAFKNNFRQATLIWLMFLGVFGVLIGDFYILKVTQMSYGQVFQIVIMAVSFLALFTFTYVFAVLARFENKIIQTIKNAFVMSILQFPKTILMIILYAIPIGMFLLSVQLMPVMFLFGLSVPVYVSAMLYNKFFLKLEEQFAEEHGETKEEEVDAEKIFNDQLDPALEEKRN